MTSSALPALRCATTKTIVRSQAPRNRNSSTAGMITTVTGINGKQENRMAASVGRYTKCAPSMRRVSQVNTPWKNPNLAVTSKTPDSADLTEVLMTLQVDGATGSSPITLSTGSSSNESMKYNSPTNDMKLMEAMMKPTIEFRMLAPPDTSIDMELPREDMMPPNTDCSIPNSGSTTACPNDAKGSESFSVSTPPVMSLVATSLWT
mmetsp:Transcript_19716/g.35198  ORF Transcript_19716/g.35198 Transcript_19716/m.35198 type:complete len:206 (-) Transcript_19716:143-760(-)